jgi:hypothetical protein
VIALIGITALYVSMLYLILHRLAIGFGLLGTTIVCAVVLYFTWYKNLPPPRAVDDYDETDVDMAAAGTVQEAA